MEPGQSLASTCEYHDEMERSLISATCELKAIKTIQENIKTTQDLIRSDQLVIRAEMGDIKTNIHKNFRRTILLIITLLSAFLGIIQYSDKRAEERITKTSSISLPNNTQNTGGK